MKKMILTAGPSITQKEAEYVLDAVKTGWNEHWSDYLTRFERAFAAFIGTKYALATSSCTGAMHLALLVMGIGPGDEVIVPDLAWVATASAVRYTGAKPVFADVLEDTWCLDPRSVKRLMTKKTKAIMPVHLYGHPCEMDEIGALAKKAKVRVIEDAAQAIGSRYRGHRPGKLGHIGCFSFQGAKIMVTGEGGMLVTDDERLYEKAKYFNNHGRDPKGSFRIFDVGYKYKMSNIQAALGLAQLERIEELVEKKRLIYRWYRQRLRGISALTLNTERPGVTNNYWMTSLVLNGRAKTSRDELMRLLRKKYAIDTRTFFYPISGFKPFKTKKANPVGKRLSLNGVNLPSGHHLTEDQADYICHSLKKILKIK